MPAQQRIGPGQKGLELLTPVKKKDRHPSAQLTDSSASQDKSMMAMLVAISDKLSQLEAGTSKQLPPCMLSPSGTPHHPVRIPYMHEDNLPTPRPIKSRGKHFKSGRVFIANSKVTKAVIWSHELL